MMRIRNIAAAGLVAVGLVAIALPASAHVTVDAPGAVQGGSDQIINVRVPCESNTASTVAVKFQLPTNTPIATVLVQPTPGWTFKETTISLAKPIVTDDGDITQAVSEIDWTALPGQGVKPGEFQQFTLIAGLLPTASSLTFKAIQTYSDGTVVSWIEIPAPGSNVQPDHPAPTLDLPAATSTTAAPAKSSSNAGAIGLAAAALALAAAALGLSIVGRARRGATA